MFKGGLGFFFAREILATLGQVISLILSLLTLGSWSESGLKKEFLSWRLPVTFAVSGSRCLERIHGNIFVVRTKL